MDAWADGMTHALMALLADGPRGRDWLLDAALGPRREPRGGNATRICLFQRRDEAKPGRRDFVVPNLATLADAYRDADPDCDTRLLPDPTGAPLRDQIADHARFDLLVVPHGAGMTHAIWAAPGACAVVLLPTHKTHD